MHAQEKQASDKGGVKGREKESRKWRKMTGQAQEPCQEVSKGPQRWTGVGSRRRAQCWAEKGGRGKRGGVKLAREAVERAA